MESRIQGYLPKSTSFLDLLLESEAALDKWCRFAPRNSPDGPDSGRWWWLTNGLKQNAKPDTLRLCCAPPPPRFLCAGVDVAGFRLPVEDSDECSLPIGDSSPPPSASPYPFLSADGDNPRSTAGHDLRHPRRRIHRRARKAATSSSGCEGEE